MTSDSDSMDWGPISELLRARSVLEKNICIHVMRNVRDDIQIQT